MSKDKTPKQEQPQDASKAESPKRLYFFPNDGDATAFSVEAASYEEAVNANTKHRKENK